MAVKDWLAVFVMASTGTFLAMVFIVVSPMLPLVAEHFGGGKDGAFVAQWVLTMPSIGVIIGGPTTGWFVERVGARVVLFTCLIVFALAGTAGLFVESQSLLLASRLVVGLAATGLVTAAMGLIVEIFTEQQRGSILGLQNAIATALSVVVTLSSGAIAEHHGWRAPFALYGLSLPILLLALIVIPAVSRRQAASGGSPGGTLALFAPMLPVYALITLGMIISFQSASQVPVLLAADGIASPQTISEILGAGTVLFTVGAIGYGTLRARAGLWWTFALALALQGIGILGLSLGHGIVGIGAGVLLLNLGSGVQTPNLTHWVMDKAPLPVRGRAMGLLFSAQFLGPFLNSSFIAPAISAYGLRNILAVIASLIAVGVALAVLRARSAPIIQGSH
jgi:MFS family permease